MVVSIFDQYAADYDHWFDVHPEIYTTQLSRVRSVLPGQGRGLEVGVGSGRFAAGLGIRHGIDPSLPLITMARRREIEAVIGVGESLPYQAGTFDYILMITVICFMDDFARAFKEAFRVIRPGGTLIVAFMEKDSEIARRERKKESAGRFLQHAAFQSTNDVTTALAAAGFSAAVENFHGFCIVTAQKA